MRLARTEITFHACGLRPIYTSEDAEWTRPSDKPGSAYPPLAGCWNHTHKSRDWAAVDLAIIWRLGYVVGKVGFVTGVIFLLELGLNGAVPTSLRYLLCW